MSVPSAGGGNGGSGKKRGSNFWGCLGSILLILLMVAVIWLPRVIGRMPIHH
jgi:hypothetical protein